MKVKQKTREVLGFDDTWPLVFGIPVIAFFVPLLFFKATLSDGLAAYMPEVGMSLFFTITYWFSVRAVFIALRRRYPDYRDTRKRILLTIAGILVVFFAVFLTCKAPLRHIFQHEARPDVSDFNFMFASLMIIALVSALYESIFFYDRWKRSMLETEQLRREHVESQLEGLKNQVNPHFLFNSLNTLAYIIPENPEKAVDFVRKLSKVYRYILEIRDTKLIPLEEELNFLHSYIFLLKERFGDNLKIRIDLPERLHKALIVPLSLQILFENAIKHNIISARDPLTIEVFAEDDRHIVVRNNHQKKRQEIPSTQVGLQNIRNRYAFFSDDQVSVAETPEFFSVNLPLL
jgi:two-component system, LytTR family, sensor kinase